MIVTANYNNLPRGTRLKVVIIDVRTEKEITSTITMVEGDAFNYSIPVQLVAEASPDFEFMDLWVELFYETYEGGGWTSAPNLYRIIIRVYSFDHLQITSVEYPKQVRKGETFTANVTLQYNFYKVSNASIALGLFEEWMAHKLDLTPAGSTFQLKGKGTKTISFRLTAPSDEAVMNLIVVATYYHIDPQLAQQMPGMAWLHYWHDESGWNWTFSVLVNGTIQTEQLRITSVEHPSTTKLGEPFSVKVHIDYSFQNATQVFIGIQDEDLEEYVPTEPSGYIELQGTGAMDVSLELAAPPKVGTLNLVAQGWYLKDKDWAHGEEWYKRFKVEVVSPQAVIYGYVTDGHGHRLEDVSVTLFWDGELVKTVYTNNKGEYRIEDPEITVPKEGKGFLAVVLNDEDNCIAIYDCSISGYEFVLAHARFPEFEVKTDADLEQNLLFPVGVMDDPSTQEIREDHLDDLAYIYYNTYLALKFYRDKLKVTFGENGICDHTPLQVYAFKNEIGV